MRFDFEVLKCRAFDKTYCRNHEWKLQGNKMKLHFCVWWKKKNEVNGVEIGRKVQWQKKGNWAETFG